MEMSGKELVKLLKKNGSNSISFFWNRKELLQ